MGNSTSTKHRHKPARNGNNNFSASTGVLLSDKEKTSLNNDLSVDQIDDEELTALKQVCLSYIDMIEFVIDGIPEKKDNEPEPDFDPVFLQLKTFVTSAKKQLYKATLQSQIMEQNEKPLTVKSDEIITSLPDLPMEEPPTPSVHSIISPSADDLSVPHGGRHHQFPSTSSVLSETSETSNSSNGHGHVHTKSTVTSLNWRKFTRNHLHDDDDESTSNKMEKKRIQSEIRTHRRKLKVKKFELLPNSVWDNYLLPYLCRTEQFLLSSTCKFIMNKCGLRIFSFSDKFDEDNIYWRQNFYPFQAEEVDGTLLIKDGKFESFTSTQKRQLKYYLIFYNKFISERERKKSQYLEKKESLRNSGSRKSVADDADDDDDKKEEDDDIDKKENVDDDDIELEIIEENKKNDNDDDDKKEDDKKDDDDEDEEEEDLYAEEIEINDDRPRGVVLLEKYCGDYEYIDHFAEDIQLNISIPYDLESIIIRNCRNKTGELSRWLSSVVCNMPYKCPIDWIGIENNNFADRDIHRICAGLVMRSQQSSLCGLSISGNNNISDRCIQVLLKTISKKCHKLQFLKLNNCTKLTNKTCQYIVDFYSKTADNLKIHLNFIDLGNNFKIDDRGIEKLNEIYLVQQYTPTNVIVRINVAGTSWKVPNENWSKNIILRPPKRR